MLKLDIWLQVVCTGKEDRLLDCDFPLGFDTYYSDDGAAPSPDEGIRN